MIHARQCLLAVLGEHVGVDLLIVKGAALCGLEVDDSFFALHRLAQGIVTGQILSARANPEAWVRLVCLADQGWVEGRVDEKSLPIRARSVREASKANLSAVIS